MEPQNSIPLIYAYVYRNIKQASNGSDIVDSSIVITSLRKVIYKAPRAIYRDIFDEMVSMGLMEKLNKQKYRIRDSRKCEEQIKKLKEYVFPISPS